MPLSSGNTWTWGVSGKWRRRRLTRPGPGGSSGGCSTRTRTSSCSMNWIASRYDALRIRRVVHQERVEREAVARRVHLGLENRQAAPAEEAADAGEQLLLVGQVDQQLQPRARRREAGLDDRLRPIDTPAQMPRVPRDLVGGVALEVGRVEVPPQLVLGALGDGIEPQQAARVGLPGGETVLQRARCVHAGQHAARGVEQVLEQLRLPGVPHLGARAANVGDREEVERDEAPLRDRRARRTRPTTSGLEMSCFWATADIVRWCSTSHATRSASSAGSAWSRQKRRASRAPSCEWSPPRPLARS